MVDYTEYQLRYGSVDVVGSSGEIIGPAEVVLVVDNSGVPVALRVGNVTIPTAVRNLPNWNQYSDGEKSKLSGIQDGARADAVPTFMSRTGPATIQVGDVTFPLINDDATYVKYTAIEKAKLATVSPGAGEIFQGNWNASTNTPTLAGSGMTPGFKWQVTTGGVQFTRTFVSGNFAIVDTAGLLQPVASGSFTPAAGQYTADMIAPTATRVWPTPAQLTHVDALPATAAPASHVGTGGVTQHPAATTTVAGFQSTADKINAGMFGFALSETQPTVATGCYWYQPSTGRLRRFDSSLPRFWIVVTRETTSPTSANDAVAGFDNGCMWIDTTNMAVWFCVDSSTGAAKWQQLIAPAAASLGGTSIVAAPSAAGVLQFKGLAVGSTTGNPTITSDGTTVTINTPIQPTGSQIVSAVDAEFGSTDWHAGAASVQTEPVPLVWTGNTLVWTDQPAAVTEFTGVEFRAVRDLTNAKTLKFSRVMDSTFGATGAKLYLDYSIDNQSTWTKITGSDLAIDGSSAFLATADIAVPTLAKTTATWLRVMGSGGDGVIDPRVRNLITTIDFPVTTASGVRSNTFVSYLNIYTSTLAWTVPSPESEFTVHNRQLVDLSFATEMQLSAEVTVAASLATTRIYVQYSKDNGATFSTISGTETTFNVIGTRASGWAAIPVNAQQDNIQLRVFGGNASTAGQTATFKTVVISIRNRTVTPILAPSSTTVWSPITLTTYGSAWPAVPVGNTQEVLIKCRVPVDTQNAIAACLYMHVTSAGKTGTIAYLQYSTDLGATWATIAGTNLAMDSVGRKSTGTVALPSQASSTSCIMRVAADNPATPAGTSSMVFGLCILDLQYSISAVPPWTGQITGGGSSDPPPLTITASNQSITSGRVFVEGTATQLTLPAANSGIDECKLYCNKAVLFNLLPAGGEVIDGVGTGGVDVMPFKWIKLIRRRSGVVTWFEE